MTADLITRWRERAAALVIQYPDDRMIRVACVGLRECADELEATLRLVAS